MKPRDKLRHDDDKRKRQLLSPDLDQHQIKLTLCGAALYRSNAKSCTVIVQKLGGNGHQHTPLAVVAKRGFVPVTFAEMAQRNKICVMSKLNVIAKFCVELRSGVRGKGKPIEIHRFLHRRQYLPTGSEMYYSQKLVDIF